MGVQIKDTSVTLPAGNWPSLSFVPADLGANLLAWYRASDAAVSGGYVQGIADRTANAHTLGSNTPPNACSYFPTLVNGKPGFYHTSATGGAPGPATADAPSALQFDHGSVAWVIAAFEYNPAATALSQFDMLGAVNGSSFRGWALDLGSSTGSGKVQFRFINTFGSVECCVQGSTTLVNGQRYIVQATKDATGRAAGMQILINGVAETLTVVKDNLAGGTTVGSAPFSLSALFDTLNVGWAEVLVSNAAPSALQLAGMDKYLNNLYAAH